MRTYVIAILLISTLFCMPMPGDAAPQTTARPFPMATAVDAQPLLAQVRRLRETLASLGEPLPIPVQQALNAAANSKNDAHILRRVQRALDPFCLAVIHLPRGKRSYVAVNPNRPPLFEQGWRPVLIKVINEVSATAPLRLRSMNARPLPEAQAADVPARWLDMELFHRPPMRPELSGLGLEYRIVSLYSKQAGVRSATLDLFVRRDDLATRSRSKPSGNALKLWTFQRATGGWQALNDCRLSVPGQFLRVQTENVDPFMAAPVRMPGGQMHLRLRFRGDHEDVGQVFWATEDHPQFDGSRQRNSRFFGDGNWRKGSGQYDRV